MADKNQTKRARALEWAKSIRVSETTLWYLGGTTLAVLGFLLQLAWSDARKLGVPILVLVLGLFANLARYMLGQIDKTVTVLANRVAELAEASRLTPATLEQSPDLSPLAVELWTDDVKAHRARFEAFREGNMTLVGEGRTAEFLAALSGAASKSIHAVDHTDVRTWTTNPRLSEYLDEQLQRVHEKEVTLERIRFVRDEDLDDDEHRKALVEFAKRHADAGAALLLCREREVQGTALSPRGGMLLIDRGPTQACLVGKIGDAGAIEGAVAYFRNREPMRTAVESYDTIRSRIERGGLDAELRDTLGLPPAAAG